MNIWCSLCSICAWGLRTLTCRSCNAQVKILRAERDVYAAEIDGKLVMKIGPGDFTPNKDANGLPTPVKHVSGELAFLNTMAILSKSKNK